VRNAHAPAVADDMEIGSSASGAQEAHLSTSKAGGSLRLRALLVAATMLVGVVALAILGGSAFGDNSGPPVAAFSGGTGTVTSNGVLYAKNAAPVTLTVTTDGSARCVEVSGAFADKQVSDGPKGTWTFSTKAPAGDGLQSVTVTARGPSGGSKPDCGGEARPAATASYVVDNTGPSVSATVAPQANPAGWNKAGVALRWTATDGGVGVNGAPTPETDAVGADTPKAGVTKTATATDRLGNTGTGSVTVKLDKTAPTIAGSRSPAANGNRWNNAPVTVSFRCDDALSGITACSPAKEIATEGRDQSVTGEAADTAGNSASTAVGGINIDKTKPTLSGKPTTAPARNGWYTGDVTVHWTAADELSGLDGPAPADATIGGEGAGLTATATVTDQAGNAETAHSPAVNIDRTAPTTGADAPDGWSRSGVAVTLSPRDSYSGVEATHYQVDGGEAQTGTAVSIAGDGIHTLEYWSTDRAGNAEAPKSVKVKIDGTAPTIGHALDQTVNGNGWFHRDVTVSFVCGDATSRIASCTEDRVVSTEGSKQDVAGTAVDNAGNSADDHALVSLDKTAPTITAAADRRANDAGWYGDDVTVSFTCGDALSGVDVCPIAQTLGEGRGQSASGTARDAAGNDAPATVSNINVDKTAPVISGEATGEPGTGGWYRDDVSVAWSCHDELSGLAADCPAETKVTGEGGDLSASLTATDRAGHAATRTVGGIKIDRTAPATTADVPEPLPSGWYAGPVRVTLDGTDNLSGVANTYYSVDGGDDQPYDGPFDFSTKGEHTIAFHSLDRAGNVEHPAAGGNEITLKIDGVPPTISSTRTKANDFGWNNGPVSVSFECKDAESGIAACSDPVTLSNDGEHQSVTGLAADNAGNTNETTVDDVNIDTAPPTLAGAPTTSHNAAGWYNGDVTIHWSAEDGLSGIDESTQPKDSTITGEGADLGAGPVHVSDKAGNQQAASVSGIRIDRTRPEIGGASESAPNEAGWYHKAVTVKFTCTDNLSGVATCPDDRPLTENGAGQSVTSGAAEDNAGNRAEGTTVRGINIDSQPPATTADNQCTKANGWCTGSTATVVLTAADQEELSGVKEIRYSVNGGAEEVAPGARTVVTVPLDGSGEASVKYHAVDVAGNVEGGNGVALKYDNIAPTVTHLLSPAANADQWSNADVTVRFDAKDDDSGSGVDASTVTEDVLVDAETEAAGRVVEGSASDLAGNRGTDRATVRLDKTGPRIIGSVVSGTRGDNGWYVGPVTVSFTCSDALSDVAVCPKDVTLTDNGPGQSVTRVAYDRAGNRTSATVSGIDIDREAPSVTVGRVKPGDIYTLGAVPTPSCSATDGVSGGASCDVKVTGGLPNGVGTFTYVATATDRAGNTATSTGTYKVIYRYDGFSQPINDTAHQTGTSAAGTSISTFKTGSTVPAKFQIKRADGTVVQANSAPAWLTPVRGSATTAPVDEKVYGQSASTSGSYRWDAVAAQYIYNWATPSAGQGYYHRIGVTLDDGMTYYANVGLR
jgi:hypothetical protein